MSSVFIKSVLVIGVTALLSACQSLDKEKQYDSQSDAQIYKSAVKKLKKGKYPDAVEDLEALEARYPFGDYAQKAELALVYGYYKAEDYASALAAADRFIQLYPTSPELPYAYYLKGMVRFYETMGFTDRYLPIERSQRDKEPAEQAFIAFKVILERFPDSPYATDARARMVFLRNMLGKHELEVAQHYFDKKAYLACVNRAHAVLEKFSETPSVLPALELLERAYLKLGFTKEAQQMADIKNAQPDL